jgi:hypothetical protein
MKELLDQSKKATSLVSGETPELEAITKNLEKILKPYEKYKVPGVIPGEIPKLPSEVASTQMSMIRGDTSDKALKAVKAAGSKEFTSPGNVVKSANTLNLSDLHELRKNIGKQVADRAFHAAPDEAMKLETELMRNLYKDLGNVLEKNLAGKKLRVGTEVVDAGDYYRAQNNRLESFINIESMLDYMPTSELKSPDAAAMISSILAKGGVWSAGGVAASMAGVPVNPVNAALIGGTFGAAREASNYVKASTPEYMTSILKSMSNVTNTPMASQAVTRGGMIM